MDIRQIQMLIPTIGTFSESYNFPQDIMDL